MFRIVILLLFILTVGAALACLADYPAEIILSLPHWRIVLTPIAALVAVVGLSLLLWALLSLLNMVQKLCSRSFWQQRKRSAAETALSKGLAAAFGGDMPAAEKAENTVKNCPGTAATASATLLAWQIDKLRNEQADFPAESARAAGIHIAEKATGSSAEHHAQTANLLHVLHCQKTAHDKEARLITLKRLYENALRSHADNQACHYAKCALAVNSALPWANLAVIAGSAKQGAWESALAQQDIFARYLRKNTPSMNSRQIQDLADYYKQVLLCGQAQAAADYYPQKAKHCALRAYKLRPIFIPAATLAARILFLSEETRKAEKIILEAWRQQPHPDLGMVYQTRGGTLNIPAERLQRAQKLAELQPESACAHKLLAEAALIADDMKNAAEAAAKAVALDPTQHNFIVSAIIAHRQKHSADAAAFLAQSLTAPLDAAWYADGKRCAAWQAIAPLSGQIGICAWQRPQHDTDNHDTGNIAADLRELLPATITGFLPATKAVTDNKPATSLRTADENIKIIGRDVNNQTHCLQKDNGGNHSCAAVLEGFGSQLNVARQPNTDNPGTEAGNSA